MDFEFRPIENWPGKFTTTRTRARFRSTYTDTLRVLDTELRHLAARQVVLQIALTAENIRLDGRPRSGARPAHPGVILSFESRRGPLAFPCDTFSTWEDNLRAIALSLAHLRTVDRYGVTQRGEQYRGWERLPPPPQATNGVAEALELLASLSGMPYLKPDAYQEAYRRAALHSHPDRGGDAETFKRVQAAWELIKSHTE